LELTHENRYKLDVMNAIFQSILALVQCIPHGVVVFFTSYAYMKHLIDHWTSTGDIEVLRQIKVIFTEPRNAVDSEKVWNSYKKVISQSSGGGGSGGGGILLCVIGGKLSEGINFSDDLARGVLVVGLPYPDRRDTLLQMKLKYADSIRPGSSTELYESICMKAVNQSIGRAIRHIKDFAAIILLDHRYRKQKIQTLLPNWISKSLVSPHSFNEVTTHLLTFFKEKI
jgi:chromosome transmission fidelity protein 1